MDVHNSGAAGAVNAESVTDQNQLLISQIRLEAFAGRKNIPRHLLGALQRHEFHG
jgi:hypothetical protein